MSNYNELNDNSERMDLKDIIWISLMIISLILLYIYLFNRFVEDRQSSFLESLIFLVFSGIIIIFIFLALLLVATLIITLIFYIYELIVAKLLEKWQKTNIYRRLVKKRKERLLKLRRKIYSKRVNGLAFFGEKYNNKKKPKRKRPNKTVFVPVKKNQRSKPISSPEMKNQKSRNDEIKIQELMNFYNVNCPEKIFQCSFARIKKNLQYLLHRISQENLPLFLNYLDKPQSTLQGQIDRFLQENNA